MKNEENFYMHQLIKNLNDVHEKYQHALDLLQSLLNAYGCKTPKWEEARNLLDQERPIIQEEVK